MVADAVAVGEDEKVGKEEAEALEVSVDEAVAVFGAVKDAEADADEDDEAEALDEGDSVGHTYPSVMVGREDLVTVTEAETEPVVLGDAENEG